MLDQDQTATLQERIQLAHSNNEPVCIVGGNSKPFLGQCNATHAQLPASSLINTSEHSGVVGYEPTELVITVRSGTSMQALEALLSEHNQMLPFEPPVFNNGTIGGVLACGLSGPARAFSGSARDYVLGMHVINGQAQVLKFGGEVMKNVAGYDAARLHVGAYGTLGLLLQTSMKVLPKPEAELTVQHELETPFDTTQLQRLFRRPLPITAASIDQHIQTIRLSGSESAVSAAAKMIGGETVQQGQDYWRSIRELQHTFFQDDRPLWRISVPDFAEPLKLDGDSFYDWGGAQRFVKTDAPAQSVFSAAANANGHASCYSADRLASDVPAFQPITGSMAKLQSRVRDSFDAQRLFNRGRFHPELDKTTAAHPVRQS